MLGKHAFQVINEKRNEFTDLALRIWNNPEPSWREVQACQWTAEYLEANGFIMERNYVGLKTAIHAVWGEGKPEIGFCGI